MGGRYSGGGGGLGLSTKAASCLALELAVLRRGVSAQRGPGDRSYKSRQYILRRAGATVPTQAPSVTAGLRGPTHSCAFGVWQWILFCHCSL